MTRRILILVCAILAMGACGREKRAAVRVPQPSDTLYTGRAALKVYGSDPERALTIIDSALVVGNVSPFKADFIRARIYANSLEGTDLNRAVALCESLLKQDSTKVVDNATFANRNNVLGVMMDACRKNNDDERWIQCAIERAELSRNHGMATEALRMEAEIGAAMTRVGRRDEGLIKLEQVIRSLDQGAPSIDRMDALIVARKRRILVFEQYDRFQDMIPDAQAIIRKLDDYRSRPQAYARDSFRLPDERSMGPYCDFYNAQAWCYIARAFSQMNPPDIAEVRRYVHLFEGSDYGRTYSGRLMIAPAWKCLGRWDKLLAIDAEAESRMGVDTLNPTYANILKDRADEAMASEHYSRAMAYMDRYTRLQEQLSEKRLASEAQDYAARYHAMEQEQMIRQAQAASTRKDAIILVIAVILLIITVFTFYSVHQQQAIVQKNRVLVRMINELSGSPEPSQADTSKPDRKLFEQIDGAIRGERLYSNVFLQRQDIIDRFNISRHALNELFSAYAGGQSFTAYINGIRMQDAIHLIQKEPDTSISAIAEAVGFTPANFREQFKRQFGMTPTEYRQNL